MPKLDPQLVQFILLVGVIVGAAACFAGYKLFKFFLGLSGFLVGAGLGLVAAKAGGADGGAIVLVALIGGAIGAVLAIVAYFVGVFLIGAGIGVVLVSALLHSSGADPEPAALAIGGLIFGVLAVAIQKLMIIFSTAVGGAYAMVAGAYALMVSSPRLNAPQLGIEYLAAWVILAILGMVVQYSTSKDDPTPNQRTAPQPAPPTQPDVPDAPPRS